MYTTFLLASWAIFGVNSLPYGSDSSSIKASNFGPIISYSGAYNSENKIVEVRRVSANDAPNSNSDNYNQQNEDTISQSRNLNNNEDDKLKLSRALQQPQGNTHLNSVTGLDQDAIIFPDNLSKLTPRDSYGNPVTQYTILPEEIVTQKSIDTDIGHRTDINKDKGIAVSIVSDIASLVANPNKSQQPGFVVPSYASGILSTTYGNTGSFPKPQISLAPPTTSDNFNYPNDDKIARPTETNTNVNVVQPSKVLTPPLPSGISQYNNNNNNYNSQSTEPNKSFVQASFQDQKQQEVSSQNLPQRFNSGQQTQPSSIVNPTQTSSTTTKYTGGFGGAPGLLTPFNKPIAPSPVTPQKIPSEPQIQTQTQYYNPNTQSVAKPGTSLLPPPVLASYPQTTLATRNPQPTSQGPVQHFNQSNKQQASITKYTGSFGGPPGILSPYDNIRKIQSTSN